MTTGARSADVILEKVKDDRRRSVLTSLASQSGIQGAQGLKYLVQLLRYYADGAELPPTPQALSRVEARFVESRCVELLEPHENTALFPRMRQLPEVL